MTVVAPFVVAAFIGAVIAFAFIVWARWLGGTYGAPRWIRSVGFVPGGLWFALFVLSLVGLGDALDATTSTSSAADRQRILANVIAQTIWNFVSSMPIVALGVIAMLFLTWRYRWSKKLPTPEGNPPYR